MTPRPQVTVLMSAYNAERHLAEAMDSVLAQTFRDFEFLIFEDGSNDSTLGILKSYSDPRIRLVENGTNLGLTRNLERGMQMARGDCVARMDADDICMPHRLASQLNYLSAHPEVSALGSAVTFFGKDREKFVAYQPLVHDEIKCALLYGFTMLHPSVMLRKPDFDRHGLNYDPAFEVSQDHDLWVRAVRKVKFANLREPLLDLRVHDDRTGVRQNDLQRHFSSLVRKRQLHELGVAATPQELQMLDDRERCVATWTVADCRRFEVLLSRIIEANSKALIFNQAVLSDIGAGCFRELCRQMLISGNEAGLYYWKSRLMLADGGTFRQRLGMAYRSSTYAVRRRGSPTPAEPSR
jgi:glycosyltransferase involved in cell wall biosynthesis